MPMEENRSLFSLNIDPTTKSHLVETARWARILAIAGVLSLIAVIAAGIYQVVTSSGDYATVDEPFGSSMQQFRVVMIIVYIIILAIAIFPVYYMFRFSSKMSRALAANQQDDFNDALLHLKLYFRFLGVITLISFVLVAISFVIGVIGVATL